MAARPGAPAPEQQGERGQGRPGRLSGAVGGRSASRGRIPGIGGSECRWCSPEHDDQGRGSGSRVRRPLPGMGCAVGMGSCWARRLGGGGGDGSGARLLEAVGIDLNPTRDAVHLGAGAEAGCGRLSRGRQGGQRHRRRCRSRRGPGDVAVGTRRGLALRLEPAAPRGHAVAVGEGRSAPSRVSAGGSHGGCRGEGSWKGLAVGWRAAGGESATAGLEEGRS